MGSFLPLIYSIFLVFFLVNSHIRVLLIQLESLSLILIALILFFNLRGNLKIISVFILFCVIASEGALGLSFLIINSRYISEELEKFRF